MLLLVSVISDHQRIPFFIAPIVFSFTVNSRKLLSFNLYTLFHFISVINLITRAILCEYQGSVSIDAGKDV